MRNFLINSANSREIRMKMKRHIIILAAILFTFVTVAFGAPFKCPICGSNMTWTGETKIEWSRIFYLHKCAFGHDFWFKSASAPDENQESSSEFGSSQTLKCPVCGRSVMWTGETTIESSKMFKVYKCPFGHRSIGR